MKLALSKTRNFSSYFLGGIALTFSLFCYSPHSRGLHYDITNPYYFQVDSESPVLFYKSSGGTSPLLTLSDLPVFHCSFVSVAVDLPSLEIFTGQVLTISAYLRHVFYAVPSINAP